MSTYGLALESKDGSQRGKVTSRIPALYSTQIAGQTSVWAAGSVQSILTNLDIPVYLVKDPLVMSLASSYCCVMYVIHVSERRRCIEILGPESR